MGEIVVFKVGDKESRVSTVVIRGATDNYMGVISKLYAAHSEGNKNMGFDIEAESAEIKDCLESNILDLMIAKKWALKYATNAAATVLRVDQIIMAKRAGGPKPRDTSGGMDQDDD